MELSSAEIGEAVSRASCRGISDNVSFGCVELETLKIKLSSRQ